MRETEHSPENLLRRLNDRDVEMSVLLHRVGILLEKPRKGATHLDRHATPSPATASGASIESGDGKPKPLSSPSAAGCDLAKDELYVHTENKAGSQEALKACLARMCRSQQQVSDLHRDIHMVSS